MTHTTDNAFDFSACPDAGACRTAMQPLLTQGDWSEVHCGRCGAQGIVRHQRPAVDGAAETPAPAPAVAEPAPEPVTPPSKGGRP